jgi:hypothetical protein
VVVENIGGAGASLGAATVAKARPDGYTILLGGTLPHVNEALLKARPLYDPNKDLDPIMQLALGYLAIAVHPSVPAKSLDELVKYAKGNPGKVSYGHVGIGSTNHLTGELFKSVAGIPEVVQIPYRGAGPVITDLIGGQIPMGVMAVTPQSLGLHKSGTIRILAITSTRPLLAAPELPTVVQAGFPALSMKRREFIAGIGGTAAVWPLTARGQQVGRVWRVGYLGVGLASNWTNEVEALRSGLRDLGYAEGKNILIEFRWAERANETLDLATQLVRLNVDVIFAPASTHVNLPER